MHLGGGLLTQQSSPCQKSCLGQSRWSVPTPPHTPPRSHRLCDVADLPLVGLVSADQVERNLWEGGGGGGGGGCPLIVWYAPPVP